MLWLASAVLARLSAQCSTQWLPGHAVPGIDSDVYATTMWDPDGAGPAPAVVVVGGRFTIAGSALANNVAIWDPVSRLWSALGSGVGDAGSRSVFALTTLPNGDLVVGGDFTTAGGVIANRIARWNGTNWSALGSGVGGSISRVSDLTVLPNGDLVACGSFTVVGGVSANHIARWDGTGWSALGAGINGVAASSLTVLPNGDLIVGGWFTSAGGVAANNIARWNGLSWSALGAGINGLSGASVSSLTTLPNGDLVAGGDFTTAGGMSAVCIARWDGASWSALGAGINGLSGASVSSLTTLPNGNVVAGGRFTSAGGVAANNIASWDGTSWSALGAGLNDIVLSLTVLPNGDLMAGGWFTTAGGGPALRVARWNGASWSVLGSGFNGSFNVLTTMPNGDLVAGGYFTSAGGVPASFLARRHGANWSALGSGVSNSIFHHVWALAPLPNGALIVGGSFPIAGGVSANNIARWDGTSWSALGAGTSGLTPAVAALTTLPNGNVVAGGCFTSAGGASANHIARWDGASWSALGPGLNDWVQALMTLPNGDLVAGGFFTTAGSVSVNRIARWDGATWSALGPGMNNAVLALTTLPNGDLVAGGQFTTAGAVSANGIARWNGTSWSALGSGMGGSTLPSVRSLWTLPNGDLVAGGDFTFAGGTSAHYIARWDGTSWSSLGSGMGSGLAVVNTLTALPNGDLAAGGNFTTAGGNFSGYFAELTTTCPATAVSAGAGCTGSGGSNVLTAMSLPWLGAVFRARATGLPTNCLAVGAFGFQPLALPMPTVHPAGQAGCTLLVSDDILLQFARVNGTLLTDLAIPPTTAIVGGVFYHQVVPVEIDASGTIVALTTTNALTLTVGAF